MRGSIGQTPQRKWQSQSITFRPPSPRGFRFSRGMGGFTKDSCKATSCQSQTRPRLKTLSASSSIPRTTYVAASLSKYSQCYAIDAGPAKTAKPKALGHDGPVCLVGILRLRKPVRLCEPTRYAQDDERGLNQRPWSGLRFISGTWSSTFPFSSR
jgi:hypothetical protein